MIIINFLSPDIWNISLFSERSSLYYFISTTFEWKGERYSVPIGNWTDSPILHPYILFNFGSED